MKQRELPVQAGEETTLTIKSIGDKGDGIARINGYVVVVAGAQQGRRYKVKITKTLEKVGFAQVVEEVELPPEEKVVPPPQAADEEVPEASEEFGEE